MIDTSKVQRWPEFEQNKRGEWVEGQMVVSASEYDALAAENAKMKCLLRLGILPLGLGRKEWIEQVDALLGEEK